MNGWPHHAFSVFRNVEHHVCLIAHFVWGDWMSLCSAYFHRGNMWRPWETFVERAKKIPRGMDCSLWV